MYLWNLPAMKSNWYRTPNMQSPIRFYWHFSWRPVSSVIFKQPFMTSRKVSTLFWVSGFLCPKEAMLVLCFLGTTVTARRFSDKGVDCAHCPSKQNYDNISLIWKGFWKQPFESVGLQQNQWHRKLSWVLEQDVIVVVE